MKYKVIQKFHDLEDKLKTQPKGRLYKAGDDYPATKREVDEQRVEELLGNNVHGVAFIEEVEADK